MKSDSPDRPTLPAALAMPCALVSLFSGIVSLIVSFLLWWNTFAPAIRRVGEQAGLVSALLGLILAGIALSSSQRKSVRRVALAALLVNLTILSLTIDTIFMLIR